MSNYIFIESRDPFASRDTSFVLDTAIALKQRGHDVFVFLVQNGVFAARVVGSGTGTSPLSQLVEAGVPVLADDFSLDERGIQSTDLNPVVNRSSIDALVTLVVHENTRAIWH